MELSDIMTQIAESLIRIIGLTGIAWLVFRAGARRRTRNRNLEEE